MKKFITLLIIVFATTFTYAYNEPTRLTISTTSSIYLRVMIDGNKYVGNNNNFYITNLGIGYHNVKIFQQKKMGNNKVGYKLIYSGNIIMKPLLHMDIVINRFGNAFVDEMIMGNDNVNNEGNDWNDNANNNWEDMQLPITNQAFSQLKEAIKNEVFADDKLGVAKQAIGVNYFTSAQVKELVGLFTWDDKKLEVAKYAYKFTVDKGNYFILNDAFTFSSNKKELLKYLETVQE